MERYPDVVLWEELTYLAYHLHWSLDDLLDLEHRQRARLLATVGDLERRRDRPTA
jgi:hypothetical protein